MPSSSSTKGIVYIVGGGPGDPGLITVKGLDCLRRADVVLYDRLVAQELLNEVPTHAELIDVGKEPKRHRRSQDEINALLVEKAREGKIVVRLKGGDPFVFGRGGEECQALAEAGIRYEVVPGVSSAIAVPAYAGIPVTQRGVTTAFTVVAGHTAAADSTIDALLDARGCGRPGRTQALSGSRGGPRVHGFRAESRSRRPGLHNTCPPGTARAPRRPR